MTSSPMASFATVPPLPPPDLFIFLMTSSKRSSEIICSDNYVLMGKCTEQILLNFFLMKYKNNEIRSKDISIVSKIKVVIAIVPDFTS